MRAPARGAKTAVTIAAPNRNSTEVPLASVCRQVAYGADQMADWIDLTHALQPPWHRVGGGGTRWRRTSAGT